MHLSEVYYDSIVNEHQVNVWFQVCNNFFYKISLICRYAPKIIGVHEVECLLGMNECTTESILGLTLVTCLVKDRS